MQSREGTLVTVTSERYPCLVSWNDNPLLGGFAAAMGAIGRNGITVKANGKYVYIPAYQIRCIEFKEEDSD